MRIALTLLFVLLSTAAAQAQRVAVAGKPLLLHSVSSTNPDCSSRGEVVVRVTSPPSNGTISIRKGGVFQNFAPSDSRNGCNRRRLAGSTPVYIARRGYTGPDAVTIEYIWPTGAQRAVTYNILVR